MTLYIIAVVVAVILVVIVLRVTAEDLSRLPAEKLAAIALEKAEEYRAFHNSSRKEELDWSLDSIKKLDEFLVENFKENRLEPDTVETMGMYLGETLRRAFDGQWKYNEGFGRLCIEVKDEGYVFPINLIERELDQKESGQLWAYVQSIEERRGVAQGQVES